MSIFLLFPYAYFSTHPPIILFLCLYTQLIHMTYLKIECVNTIFGTQQEPFYLAKHKPLEDI